MWFLESYVNLILQNSHTQVFITVWLANWKLGHQLNGRIIKYIEHSDVLEDYIAIETYISLQCFLNSPNFLQIANRILQPNGIIILKTKRLSF